MLYKEYTIFSKIDRKKNTTINCKRYKEYNVIYYAFRFISLKGEIKLLTYVISQS